MTTTIWRQTQMPYKEVLYNREGERMFILGQQLEGYYPNHTYKNDASLLKGDKRSHPNS